MEVKARHTYVQSVDAVFKKFGDKASIERKFKELGSRSIKVDTCKLTKTSLDMVLSREIPVNAPSLLKKFLGEWNLTHQEEHWKGIAGKSYQGNVKITIKGVPVTITGRMVLVGDAKGCTNEVTLNVESGIPLIGKKLAEFVGQSSVTEMQKQYEHIKGSLVSAKPPTKVVTAKPVSAKSVVKAAATKSVKKPAAKTSTDKPVTAKTTVAKPTVKAVGAKPAAAVKPVGTKPSTKAIAAKPAAKKVAKKTALSEPAAKKAEAKQASKPAAVKKPAAKKKGG